GPRRRRPLFGRPAPAARRRGEEVDRDAGHSRPAGRAVPHHLPRVHHRCRRRQAGGLRAGGGPCSGRGSRDRHCRPGRRGRARRQADVDLMRRPLTALAVAGTTAHHGLEVFAGVGLVFQPYLGLPGSIAFWSVNLPVLLWAAARGGRRWDPVLANALGTGLAGALVHFTIWPWRVRRGVPLLTEAEGLSPGQLPAYNAVLWTWAVASALALLRETSPGNRRWFALGLLNGIP